MEYGTVRGTAHKKVQKTPGFYRRDFYKLIPASFALTGAVIVSAGLSTTGKSSSKTLLAFGGQIGRFFNEANMGESQIAMTPAEIEVREWRQRLDERMAKSPSKTGLLEQSETAVTVRDQLIAQQVEKVHELEADKEFWKEQAGLLAEQNERLHAALQTAWDALGREAE